MTIYTTNCFIPTTWKALPRRVPEVKPAYYRHWVDDTSDYFITITPEQREAPDQYIGDSPPAAMLGLLEAKALRHLLDGFIARAEAKRAEKPRDEFSEVFNLPTDVSMDDLIDRATYQHVRHMQREHPNEYLAQRSADEEMAKRAEKAADIAKRNVTA